MRRVDVGATVLHREDGAALLSVMMLSVLGVLLTGALTAVMLASMNGAAQSRAGEVARSMAEGGVNATLFRIEAETNPDPNGDSLPFETYLANQLGLIGAGGARPGTKTFAGTMTGGSYTVNLTDPTGGDGLVTLTAVGTDAGTQRTRTVVALARGETVVEALNYALFGNRIEFHNHNNVPFGVNLMTTIWSNGTIQIAKGVSINGLTQAVNSITPNASGGNTLPNTVLSPPGQQGDPDPDTSVPSAPVQMVVPAPAIKPFPAFDFAGAKTAAQAQGRVMSTGQFSQLLATAQACANALPSDGVPRRPGYAGAPGACSVASVYSAATGVTQANVPVELVHYKAKWGGAQVCPTNCANPRSITVPNGTNANAFVPLGSADGVSNAPDNTNLYEIRLVGNPLADTLLYINGQLSLATAQTTLLQIQGGLVVNGGFTASGPTELLAWYNRTGPKWVPLGQSLFTDAAGNSTVAKNLVDAAPGMPFDIIYSNWPAIAANGGVKAQNGTGPLHIEGTVYSVAESHFHKSDPDNASYSLGSEIADTIHNCQYFAFAYDPQARFTLGFQAKQTGRVKLQVVRLEDR